MNYFSSDHHFGHAKVLTYCPDRKFSDIQEMNKAFIENWNAVVKPEDTVYHLGDFSMSFESVVEVLPQLAGHKVLILGNHDKPHPANKHSRTIEARLEWEKKYLHWGFEAVHLSYIMTLKNGLKVRLYHMPYLDEGDPKQNHKQHRLVDDGVALICGHIHQHWTMRWSRPLRTPQLNVGVDRWKFTPVSEDEVVKFFETAVMPKRQSDQEVDREAWLKTQGRVE